MPRDGNGQYNPPAGTPGIPLTTIESARYNAFVADISAEQNNARPIATGGTGGLTAVEGSDNLSTISTNIASDTTTDLEDATGVNVTITGDAEIEEFGTVQAGARRYLRFTGSARLVHDGTKLILPGETDIVTTPGDTAVFMSMGSGNWRCISYQRNSLPFASGSENFLINGRFDVNQRAASGPLPGGSYGHDRWRAGLLHGANYNAVSADFVLVGGVLEQVIESPGLAGEVVTISVDEMRDGDLAIDIDGASGIIKEGNRSVTMTVPITSTGNVVFAMSVSSGTPTFSRKGGVQLNLGAGVQYMQRRTIALEMALCQRYYETISRVLLLRSTTNDTAKNGLWQFCVQKRDVPAIVIGSSSNAGTPSVAAVSTTAVEISTINAVNSATSRALNVTADAEL